MRNNIATGIHYLMEGFALIRKPGLKRFVAIPLILNTLLFIGLFFLARHFFAELTVWVMGYFPTWLQWLTPLFWLAFLLSYLLVFIYLFVAIANLVSAPFNSLLAEKVELYL